MGRCFVGDRTLVVHCLYSASVMSIFSLPNLCYHNGFSIVMLTFHILLRAAFDGIPACQSACKMNATGR